ncbi:MAG: hypothetical protein K6F77_04580 [Lachnospiraceae bacterium]|nr:hypothetical protein [Lachnospiraceae bacterium]
MDALSKKISIKFYIAFLCISFICAIWLNSERSSAVTYVLKTYSDSVSVTSSQTTTTQTTPTPSASPTITPGSTAVSQTPSSTQSSTATPTVAPTATPEVKTTTATILTYTYQKPVISSSRPGYKAINKYFSNHYKTFLANKTSIENVAKENYKTSAFTTPYTMTGKWTVTYISGNIISLKYIYNDTIASENSTSISGVTFDMKTGKKVNIKKYTNYSTNKIKNKLVKSYKKYAKKNTSYTFWNNNVSTLKATSMSSLPFCIQNNGKIQLLFSPGVLAPQAVGIITFNL